MNMNINVTIKLEKNGNVTFEYYEPENGDFYRICTTMQNAADEECRVGSELLSWLPLMADALEEQDD